ncbi:MAG: hypothetical protein AB1792_01205 [Candidatus Zixiibacteriota bacterium]
MVLVTTAPVRASDSPIVRDSVSIPGRDATGPYWFSGFFVMAASESVAVGAHRLRREDDYEIDYNHGTIAFTRPLTRSDTALVRFRRLGFALSSRWRTAAIIRPSSSPSAPGSGSDGLIPVAAHVAGAPTLPIFPSTATASADPSPGNARWQGFKSLSFSAADHGGRDWSQGLELSVDGELTPGLQLAAAISDRAVAGADTRGGSSDGVRIGTLDRLFIEARSARFRGRWGELSLSDRAFGEAPRRATGMQLTWANAGHAVGGTIARPHGEWRQRRITLRAEESGPYRLLETPVWKGIVPGSITLWLDGQRLEEGDNRDYSVDWGRGTITINPRRSFGAHSILIAEYEEALDTYERTLVESHWSWADSQGRPRHSLALDWEGDDPSSPLSGTLTESQRTHLANDPSGSVRLPTAEHVTDGQGDYRRDVLTDGDTAYVYVGPGQGAWRVRFQWVGARNGRYRHIADEAYEYVGRGGGDFEPTVAVDAPKSRWDVSESLHLPVGATGRFSADWRGAAIDHNRLASGTADLSSSHALGLHLGAADADRLGALDAQWLHNDGLNTLSRPGLAGGLDRLAAVWGLRSSLLDSSSDDLDLTTSIPLGGANGLRLAGGLWHDRQIAAWRGLLGTRIVPIHSLQLDAEWNHRVARRDDRSAGRNDSYASALRLSPRWGTFGVGWRQQDCDNANDAFETATPYAASRWATASVAGVTLRQSWDRTQDTVGLIRRSRELAGFCPVALLGGRQGGGLTVARGERAWSGGAYTPYYRGQLDGRWTPSPSAAVQLGMTLSHQSVGLQRERFLPTRPGYGQYRYERGEYIPDPHGDFRRVLVEDPDAGATAYQGDKHLVLSWWPEWQGWRWSVDLQRDVQGRYATATFQPGAWAVPWTTRESSLAPGAQLSVRDAHRVSARPDERTEISATFGRERTVFAPVTQAENAAANINQSRRAEFRIRRAIGGGFSLESTARYERRERGGGTSGAWDADARTLLAAVRSQAQRAISGSLESRYRHDREFRLGGGAFLWGVNPGTQLRLEHWTVSAQTDLTWVAATNASRLLSALMAEGRPLGFSVTESAELRWQLPGRVTLNARLSGDHRPDEPDRWRIDVESVARW